MRPNPVYESTDVDIVRALVAEHPWAVLVSAPHGAPVSSHVPILLERDPSQLALVTHVGKPDDELHGFGDGEVLVIIQGHSGYVSPSWYAATAASVPTWNYTVAHCYGVPEILDEQRNLDELLRLVEHFEGSLEQRSYLDRDRATEIARGTVGIRVPVARFLCKRKLSQNKDAQTREGVIAGLRGPGPYRNLELALDMEQLKVEAPPD
jgi:transcriptional regulator